MEAPWDTSPASDAQLAYATTLARRIAEADWSKLDTTQVSGHITKLNSVRRALGIKMEPIEGTNGLE